MQQLLAKNSWLTTFFALAVVFLIGQSTAQAITVYAVTQANGLVRFDSATPNTVTAVGAITGLQTGENIAGLDFRPATGQLFALALNGTTARLITINTATGAASTVANNSTFTVAGTSFGFDFNPSVDRIRLVSNTGQNLRLNPVTGGIAATDTNLNPGTPSVVGAAYLGNFNGATAADSPLFVYDTSTNPDTIYLQNPPNGGTLANPITVTGVNAVGDVQFDATSATNQTFASGVNAGVPFFAELVSGTITPITQTYRGIAVEVGALPSLTVYGLTTTNQLVRFDSSRPNVLLQTTAITGVGAGETLTGIDYRPANGLIYAASASRIYTINPATGVATPGAAIAPVVAGTNFGFDFNPVPDRLRIVADTDQNYRINVDTGLNTVDTPVAYQAGDPNAGQNPNIVSAAYTNNFAGATTTVLRVIDSNLDIIATQIDPNAGVLQTAGSLGFNTTENVGYDFNSGNIPVLSLTIQGSTGSGLYTVMGNPTRAVFVGQIGAGTTILRGLTVAPGSAATNTRPLNFDGDTDADYSVFRPSNNTFLVNTNVNGGFSTVQFGRAESDTITPGDYDGDGRADYAVRRDSTATFFVLNSNGNVFQSFVFGLPGDEPVQRDYDADGRTDFAVVRRAQGTPQNPGAMTWFVQSSVTNTLRSEQFGVSSDTVAPGDYDGDGRSDLAVFRGNVNQPATFFVQQSLLGFRTVQWGLGGDLVVPGDYDGDARTDFAVLRAGTQFTWFVFQSTTNSGIGVQWGAKPDLSVQADYDGDGRTDFAVWRPQTGTFFVLRRSGSAIQFPFGTNGDFPLANYDTH